jgi:glycosyltransferase involved in cell wall biosynthesis
MGAVLHLRAVAADEQSKRLSALLVESAAPTATRGELRTIGRGGSYRSVLECVLRLRRELTRFDRVHVWDETGLSAARWLGAAKLVVSLPTKLPRSRPGSRSTTIHWVCSTPAQLSLARRRFGRDHCSLIEPGVPDDAQPAANRTTLRTRLGLAPDDRVLLAPAESTRDAGHATAVWVTSMLHIIDPRYKLIIAGTGPYAQAARKMAVALRRPDLLRVAADAGVEGSLTPAADAVLWTPIADSPVLPLAQAMRAGLPVVAADHPSLRGFLIEGRGVLLGDWRKPPAVARRVLELFERPGLLQSTALQAREEAARRFDETRFIEQYERVYRGLAEATGSGSVDAPVAA